MNEEQIKGVVEEIDAYLKKSSHWKESRILSLYRVEDITEEMYEATISGFGGYLIFLRTTDGTLRLAPLRSIYARFVEPQYKPYEKGDA